MTRASSRIPNLFGVHYFFTGGEMPFIDRSMSEVSTEATGTEATVLFVDSEPAILTVYELLCGSEYSVITARDGREALEMFGPHVDFAVLERELPEVSGDDVVRILRSEGYRTPVAFVSTVDPDPEPTVEYDEYLTKPINNGRLRSVIDAYTR